MARAEVVTNGLLNRYIDFMGEDGWRFNQIGGEGVRQIPNCQNQPYLQYERQYIADALATSMNKAAEYLGYYPAPHWITDEIVTVNSDYSWSGQTLSTRFGHLIEFGRRATTLIADDVAVAYTDTDADQIDDWATITVTGVTDIPADEIQVFFRVADGADSAASEYWQIEPLKVVKTGDSAEITGKRWLFAHPINVWRKDYDATSGVMAKFQGDTADANCFVVEVDVYRVYANAASAVQLVTGEGNVSATGKVSNAHMGQFTAHTASGQTSPSCRPTELRVSYRSGLALVNDQMDRQLAQACIRYANTLMPQQPEMCSRGIAMWNADTKVDSDSLAARDTWTPPPFGITQAGLFAWAVISARQIALKARPSKRQA